MLAALTAGSGARLIFHRPAVNVSAKPPPFRRAGTNSLPVTVPPFAAGPRPEMSAVLSTSGVPGLRLLMAWLPNAGEEELLTMAGGLVKTVEKDDLPIRLLMARWAEVNPKAMLAWAQSQPEREEYYRHSFYIANAIEAWARIDFEGAWSAAKSSLPQCRGNALHGLAQMNPEKCRSLFAADPALLNLRMNLGGDTDLSIVVDCLARTDPAATAAMLDKAPGAIRHLMASEVAGAWVKTDPAAALAWMKTLPGGLNDPAFANALEWLAGHAPDHVPALLESLPPGSLRSLVSAADFKRLAREDPVAARRRVEQMPDGIARQHGRALLMQESVRTGDFQSAREFAGQLGWHVESEWSPGFQRTITDSGTSTSSSWSGNDPNEALKELIRHIAADEPKAAAEILLHPDRDHDLLPAAVRANPEALVSALAAQVEKNRQTAEDRTLFEDPASGETEIMKAATASSACQVAIATWAERDPAAVAAWIEARPADSNALSDCTSLFASWVKSDPNAMLAWAAGREGATALAWEQIVPEYPDIALSRLDTFFSTAGTDSVEELLSDLSQRPADARGVLRKMPNEMDVDFSGVMESWLRENPEEASAWATALPQGQKRNHAAADIAKWSYEASDFEAASRWSLTLPEDSREEILTISLEGLRRTDPAKAAALIRASSLSPDEKKSLLYPSAAPP